MKRVRVIGCGSSFGGDDCLGLLAAEMLRSTLPPQVDVRMDAAGGVNVYAWCQDADVLMLIDAVCATVDLPPGTLRRIDYRAEPHVLKTMNMPGTHQMDIPGALALAAETYILPAQVLIFALAADCFEQGAGLSERLRRPLEDLVNAVRFEVTSLLAGVPTQPK